MWLSAKIISSYLASRAAWLYGIKLESLALLSGKGLPWKAAKLALCLTKQEAALAGQFVQCLSFVQLRKWLIEKCLFLAFLVLSPRFSTERSFCLFEPYSLFLHSGSLPGCHCNNSHTWFLVIVKVKSKMINYKSSRCTSLEGRRRGIEINTGLFLVCFTLLQDCKHCSLKPSSAPSANTGVKTSAVMLVRLLRASFLKFEDECNSKLP